MFSLRFTIVLFIILGVPFLIRHKFGDKYEPFPSILFPTGAFRVPVLSSEFNVDYTDLVAQKEDGSWQQVDPKRLLYPLPYTNHKFILQREFGLADWEEEANRRFSNLLVDLNIVKIRNATEQAKEETRNWLKQRLSEQGFNGPLLKIIQKERTISISNGETLREDIINEKIINLDPPIEPPVLGTGS